jgi:ribosomal protein L6P/L9E
MFTRLYFTKFKFKGKGYYIYKSFRNTIAFRFGYAHRTYVYSFFVSVRFITKTTILVFGLNKYDLLSFSQDFKQIRKINIFTGRGIRFSRQIIYQKVGKVSMYR